MSSSLNAQNSLQSYPNSDIQIDPQKYNELIEKVNHYENIIEELELQRGESMNEINQMKQHIDKFSESMRVSKSSCSCSSKQPSDGTESREKLRKLLKENKKLKDQLFKQKKDSESKISNLKRRHKVDTDGYKQN